MTNAYYKAVTKAEKDAISAQATAVRPAEGAKQSVVTPLQFQTAEITKIVVQGTSKGYADEKEWKQALQKVGIQAPDSKREIVGDTSSGGGSTINYSTVSTVTIGRTSLRVKVDSSTTHTADNKFIDRASASLAMEYKVTANELKFISDTGSYMGSLEKSLYVINAVKLNKGIVTSKILKNAQLPYTKGLWGTVDMLQFTYDMADKGFTVKEALKMYKEEVTDPRMAEAYAAVTLNVVGGGFSLKRMAQAESKVSVTRSPSKPKPAGIVESEVKAAGGESKLNESNRLNIGAGDNPRPGYRNGDIDPRGEGIEVMDANKLVGIKTGSQAEVIVQNPYGYNALEGDIPRVIESGGLLKIAGEKKILISAKYII